MSMLVNVHFFIMIKFLHANIYPNVRRGKTQLKARVYGTNKQQMQFQNVVIFDAVDSSKVRLNIKKDSAETFFWVILVFIMSMMILSKKEHISRISENFIPICLKILVLLIIMNPPDLRCTLKQN